MGRKIRRLRVCPNTECRLPHSRDRMGASNVGFQFRRLYPGKSQRREMTDEEAEFNRLNVALHTCSECDEIIEGLRSPGVMRYHSVLYSACVFTVAKVKLSRKCSRHLYVKLSRS